MREAFEGIATHLNGLLRGGEIFTAYFSGEDSDFVRFNRSAVRQAGSIRQMYLQIELILESRHAQGSAALSGNLEDDRKRVTEILEKLREMLPALPDDSHLIYATDVHSGEEIRKKSDLPSVDDTLDIILKPRTKKI